MTRKRSSPMGLEIHLPILLAFLMLPLLAQAAPLQDYTEIQQYTDGCYYNYNHYNEGDRIMTNEPCLNCTCHNKMLMCYLRVCPFTKPIGHDCIVEKREDQCCPIITCPEVPVDVAHAVPEVGTELTFPEKFGCSINGKFYLEGAQVPSNPNKPCELCYCIKNRTSCLVQECTLHIEGCIPIYNKGSCCPVRYNCDHENDVLELEDHSSTTEVITTTTTERPTTGFILTSTANPSVSNNCIHSGKLYADGARIPGETACENCYCMRGEIVCAVQECHMPILSDNGKLCHPLPAAEGECCPSNYVCEDNTAPTHTFEATTLPYSLDENSKTTTYAPVKDLHGAIPEEDLQLQAHIDEEETVTKIASTEGEAQENLTEPTTISISASTENRTKQTVADQESVTNYLEDVEMTTVSSSDFKPVKNEELITKAPTTDALHESSTDLNDNVENESITEATMKPHAKYPTENEKETGMELTTNAYESPEILTHSTESSKEIITITPAKPEFAESTTEIISNQEHIFGETMKSPNEVKPIVEGEEFTQVPITDQETNTSRGEEIATESITKSAADLENTTPTTAEVLSQTIAHLAERQQNELVTESSVNLLGKEPEIEREKYDELYTKATTTEEEEESITAEGENAITEETDTITTEAPGKLTIGKEDSSTVEPEVERKPLDVGKDQQEATATFTTPLGVREEIPTEYGNKPEAQYSTTISAESDESEIVTKVPTSEKELSPNIAPDTLKDDKESSIENLPTKPILGEYEGSAEVKPISDDNDQINITIVEPGKDHNEDDLGSGDFADPVTSEHHLDRTTIRTTFEVVTSIPQESDEDNATPTKGQDISTEFSKASDEDNKLMDLTTETISTADNIKEEKDQLESSTIKALFTDIPTSTDVSEEISEGKTETYTKTSSEAEIMVSTSSPFKTQDKTKTDEEIGFEDKILSTTISTLLEEKIPTRGQIYGEEHKDILFETTEFSGTTEIAVESEDKESSEEQEKKTDIPQKSVESTTKGIIEEHAQETSADTETEIAIETEDRTMLPTTGIHKDEEEFGITASPMLTFENISTFTTQQPTAQKDLSAQPGAETEKAKEDESSGIQTEVYTTTFRAPSDSAHVEQLPSVIPGEGNCLVGEETYENNSVVPTSDECELICRCASSIVVCERVKCDVPENLEKCTLDKTTSNKCCPSYNCGAEESTKSESEENIPYTTAPYNIIVEKETEDLNTYKYNITTTKPITSTFAPGMSIPEIEMPVAITEEPMSHIKDDSELEQETTQKSFSTTTPTEKKDLITEGRLSTTPSPIVEDKISGQEIEVPDEDVGKVIQVKQPVKEYKEQTTSSIVDRGTDSTAHIPRGEKEDTEIYVTTIASTAGTGEHTTKEEYTGEKTTPSSLISSPIPVEDATTEKSFEKLEPVPTLSSTEESNELQTQTNIPISDETADHTTKPHEPETQTIHTDIHDEKTTLPPSIDTVTPEIAQTTPSKDVEFPKVSTKLDENIFLTEENNMNMFESTTISIAREDHTRENSSEDIAFTTVMPTTGGFKEHILPIASGPSNKIEDHSIAQETSDEFLESTIVPVMEGANEYLLVTSKNDGKGTTTPTPSQFEKDIQHSTAVSQTDDETSVAYVTSAADEITISPITQYEHKKIPVFNQSLTSEMPIEELSTHKLPEMQTNTASIEDHSFTQSTGKMEEESQTTSAPKVNEMVSDNISSYSTEKSNIDTENPINLDAKPATSSSNFSVEAVQTESLSTTVAYIDQISNESTPSVEDHTVLSLTDNDNSLEQQTGSTKKVESEEKTEGTDVSTRKYTPSVNEEITTISSIEQVKGEVDHTLSTSLENIASITKSPIMKVEYEPEDGTGHSTSSPITSDESEVASTEEVVIPAKENNVVSTSEADTLYDSTTLAPGIEIEMKNKHHQVNQPTLDLSEEISGESLESEEEINNESATTPHMEELVTRHREEAISTSTIMPFNEETENEASGEEDKQIYKTKATTSEPQLPTVGQQNEMYLPAEHTDASDKEMSFEVTSNKIPEELIHSLVTTAPIVNNESVTNVLDITNDDSATKTENDIYSTSIKSTSIEESPQHIKEQILEKDVVASVTEGPVQIEVNENVSTQQPESEENITSQHIAQVTIKAEEISSDELETANILEVTKAPWATSHEYERENATSMATGDVTDKHLEAEVTKAPVSADEVKPESDRTEEDISEPPKEHIEFSTKNPTDYVDIDMATIEPNVSEANIPIGTKLPIVPQMSGSTYSDDSQINNIVTTLLPINEVSEVTTSPVSLNEIEHPTDQTTKELSSDDIHAFSTTSIPSEDVDMATINSSAEREKPLDTTIAPETLEIDTTTAIMPDLANEIADISIKEEPMAEVKKEIDNNIQVTTSLPHQVTDTKSPNTETNLEEESLEMNTVTPLSAEVLTVKSSDIIDLTTEYPTESTHSERDQFHESTTKTSMHEEISTDKLPQQITELPTKYTISTEQSNLETTELSIHTHLSTESSSELQENETELSTKDVEQEEESTELSTSSHTSFDELPERSTMLPNKEDKDSEKEPDLNVVNEVSTVKSTKQDIELPDDDFPIRNLSGQAESEFSTKSTESIEDSHKQFTELSLDVHITTEQVPVHVTELSTQSHKDDAETEFITDQIDTHKHSTHSADILPDHSTESQKMDIHSKHDGYEEKTGLNAVSTEKIPELTTKYAESVEESHEKATVPHEMLASEHTVEHTTESASKMGEHDKETTAEVIEDSSAVKLYPATTGHPLFPYYTTLPSVDFNSRIDDTSPNNTSAIENDEESFTKPSTTTFSTTTSEPIAPSAPHYQPQPPIYGPPPQYGPTQYEDEYTDEDEGEVFGPGTCRYGGKLYVSAQQIPRDDPCDFCFCFRSDIICLQQSCPPPIAGCHEEPISGFCCPRYECPVSMATVLNITTSTTTTSTTLPPHFLHHNYGHNLQRNGCLINGRSYRVGEKIESTSGPCINCTCGGDGKMKCDPQACVPEPTMQQVMAVVAAGRKR